MFVYNSQYNLGFCCLCNNQKNKINEIQNSDHTLICTKQTGSRNKFKIPKIKIYTKKNFQQNFGYILLLNCMICGKPVSLWGLYFLYCCIYVG